MDYRTVLIQTRSAVSLGLVTVFLAMSGLSCKSYTTGLQKTQTNANETSVIAAMRNVVLAQQGHAITNDGNYATFLQLVEGGYLDSRFHAESPELDGYTLTMKVGEKSFSCNADPTGEQTGRHFYVDSTSALIRVNASQPASAKDGVLRL
ncbi:MAG TPA: hypothetical protein VJU86_03330 [Pyrinomonadaceae bacterium]|nr:hypothetical protein [Pyrinomonadaceae bacterium]